jgi:DNA-binding transcriptional regulator YiaG
MFEAKTGAASITRKRRYPLRFDRKSGLSRCALTSREFARLAALTVPDSAQARAILLDVRQKYGLARGHVSAMLGAPIPTIEAWEAGRRNPCMIARKAIQLMYLGLSSQKVIKPRSGWCEEKTDKEVA